MVYNPSTEDFYNAVRKLEDTTGTQINPATKELQEQMRTAINKLGTEATLALAQAGIDALVAKDGATGAKQDALKAAVDTLATEQKLELVRLLLVDIQSKLGSVDIASMPAISGEVSVSNLPQTQQVAGEVNVGNLPVTQQVSGSVQVGNLPDVQQVAATEPLPVSINGNNTTLPVSIKGNIQSLRGLLANRPAPDAQGIVPGETTYTAVDDGWIYVSDGTQWRKWIEVGKWME